MITTGGHVAGGRFESDPSKMTKCDICGCVGTAEHKYYQCRICIGSDHDDDFEKHWLKKTNYLRYKGHDDSFTPKCQWFRGILPNSRSWGLVEAAQPEQAFSVQWGDLSGPLCLGTDAGGPSFKRSQVLFKVGVGGVVINWDTESNYIRGMGIVFGNLPGVVQTIPSGEAFAPLASIKALDLAHTPFVSWSCDASYVARNSHQLHLQPQELRKTCLSSRHGDIRNSLLQDLSTEVLPLHN